MKLFAVLATLAPLSMASPLKEANISLPGTFTLTTYRHKDAKLTGLKVNYAGYLNLYQATVRSYCPPQVEPNCPNGNDTVFYPIMSPASMVSGGQDAYVQANGLISFTPQHSHSKPNDARWTNDGIFRCDIKPTDCELEDCPRDDPQYNCDEPVAWCGLAEEPKGGNAGFYACPNPNNQAITSLFAVTSENTAFDPAPCQKIDYLAVHKYNGSIPVWSYN